mmetsp:Transcript_118197/g.341712  ORF Transcript_118197/g.341712 Transcript_118197/m.341712 type:complete len:439 (+) Transcript_118197:134-1450(+)
MSTMRERKASGEIGQIDDMQFNASLDALLAGENLNDGGSNGYSISPVGVQNSEQSAVPSMVPGVATSNHNWSNMAAMGLQGPGFAGASGGSSSMAPFQQAGMPGYGSLMDLQPAKPRSTPSIPPSDTASVASTTSTGRSKRSKKSTKRARDASAVSEDEEDRHRRRQDRNMREQQRSQKITQQIDHLKDILAAANVQFKPDKYSTLVSVADYIQSLQERSALLDVEQKKLMETISRTNEMVNEQYIPASANGSNPPGSGTLQGEAASGEPGAEYAPQIDYKSLFSRCEIPLAVLGVDGRFLECNQGFETLTGFTRDELLPTEKVTEEESPPSNSSDSSASDSKPQTTKNMSLFNLLNREYMEQVFVAMSEILRQNPNAPQEGNVAKRNDCWCGVVCLARNENLELRMNVSLVRSPQGRAKFFDCSLTPLSDVSLDQVI